VPNTRSPAPPAAKAAARNTPTDAERAAGWQLPFDGRTTAGWRVAGPGDLAQVDPLRKVELGAALAKRCWDVLDDCQRALVACSQSWWCFNGNAWENRAGELYRLAGEVARAQGK
jgi:hypothetical protein